MCGRRSNFGWLVLLFLLGSWGGMCWAEERPPVQVPYRTWVLLQEKITTLGSQLEELTQKLSEQEQSLISERQTYAIALQERDEHIRNLNDSLTRSTRESRVKGSWLVGTSVAAGILLVLSGGLLWLVVG